MFRLVPGETAPQQQSPVTCGAASLTVARLLADSGFARRVLAGGDRTRGFAEAEADVMRRTNAWQVRGRGLWADAPWPHWWGTSPWGAAAELEHGTGRRYRFTPLRHLRGSDVERVLADAPQPGAPALCYVGSRVLPRHVVLLTRDADGGVLIYEPSRGTVTRLGDPSPGASPWGGWGTAWWVIAAVE